MAKRVGSGLFINDGSFMERFKQLQREEENAGKASRNGDDSAGGGKSAAPFSVPNSSTAKGGKGEAQSSEKKSIPVPSSSAGKLAFSLKPKTKMTAAAVKLAEEDEDEYGCDDGSSGNDPDDWPAKKRKLVLPPGDSDTRRKADVAAERSSAPPAPGDPSVRKVADKLAGFVAKNGRQFEHVTRQRNPGDGPFKFLFDEKCEDYRYYEHRVMEEEKALLLDGGESQAAPPPHAVQQSYQMPASALYESAGDPIAMMEFYVKKAAQEERKRRQPKQSKDEMPPPASLQGPPPPAKKGHHMGDYIPQEELHRFLATCTDVSNPALPVRSRIQSDNVGHRLLSKMGWREGEGLGSSSTGISDPIMAGDAKMNNLGVGAHHPGQVTPDDDIYEQYKKRMMLGYRYRPNPLNNPRKAYY